MAEMLQHFVQPAVVMQRQPGQAAHNVLPAGDGRPQAMHHDIRNLNQSLNDTLRTNVPQAATNH